MNKKPSKHTKQFLFRVDPALHTRIKKAAANVGCSMSVLVRNALKTIFSQKEK